MAERLKVCLLTSLYYLPRAINLFYYQTINMSEPQEKIVPDNLIYNNDRGVYASKTISILRNGLDSAIDNDAPMEVIKNLRNQIIEEEKRLIGMRYKQFDYQI